MLAFIDRPEVMGRLGDELRIVRESGGGRMVAVQGRRQMGKSTVIERFASGSGLPYVYVTGLFRQPLHQQLAAASEALAVGGHPLPGADGVPARTWREWLGRIALSAAEGPVVVVLDEFPWLAGGGSHDAAALEGDLQAMWDRVLEKLPVLMILVGSDLAMMEQLGRHDRPLYGRFRRVVVPPLNLGEVARALPDANPFEVFDAYLVTGGYPRLLAERAASGARTTEWVRESLVDGSSPLVVTGGFGLDAEFAESVAAYRVLLSIGSAEQGQLNLGAIAAGMADDGVPTTAEKTAVQRAIGQLDAKGLLRIDEPAWAASTRLRRYGIADSYIRFWFRYVARSEGAINRGRGDLAIAAFDRDWPSWRETLVEPTVRESLTRLAASDGRLAGVEDVRAWWTRDGRVEVDAVGMSRDRSVFLGTIKWRESGGVTRREVAELVNARVPRAEGAMLAAICPTGEAPMGILSFSAEHLLRAWD